MPYEPQVTQSKNKTLAYPHYSNAVWKKPQLIYGREMRVDNIEYSDRLREWDNDSAEKASHVCSGMNLKSDTAQYVEQWLSVYYNRPVLLKYIFGGVNLASGYPYYVYGFDFVLTEDSR